MAIQPLGQLRSPDERRSVFGPTLWQRLTRRSTVDQPAADEPVREAFVNKAQLERLPRSLAPGEVVMMVFSQQGWLTSLNPGHDHAHVERCVAKPGACRSIALWTDSRERG
ncbi:MAG TPA: hypothetical protein VMP67_09330 [Candidatus Limnocylindria bacterium]|nr:hypothetical protein [Candidatus Limnocylindria bacterium]